MARFEPTASQKCAIEETGRAVLVSAAAGSGKTRVLTERLLRRIEHDADIDSFLVITFTKAAAAELRSRILDEISERLAADPDNRRLKRQSALVRQGADRHDRLVLPELPARKLPRGAAFARSSRSSRRTGRRR